MQHAGVDSLYMSDTLTHCICVHRAEQDRRRDLHTHTHAHTKSEYKQLIQSVFVSFKVTGANSHTLLDRLITPNTLIRAKTSNNSWQKRTCRPVTVRHTEVQNRNSHTVILSISHTV